MLKNDNFIFLLWIGSPDGPHTFIKKRTGLRFLFFNAISKSSTLVISELINQVGCPYRVQTALKASLSGQNIGVLA